MLVGFVDMVQRRLISPLMNFPCPHVHDPPPLWRSMIWQQIVGAFKNTLLIDLSMQLKAKTKSTKSSCEQPHPGSQTYVDLRMPYTVCGTNCSR